MKFLNIILFGEKKQPPRLHRKWTFWDELCDTSSVLPFLVLIIVITAIVLVLALVSATEANLYYNHLGGI